MQVVLGVLYCHQKNIVYRNVKSQSVFFTKKGDVKIGDAGIKQVQELTEGNYHYMPPEVFHGQDFGYEGDAWGLGVLLFEMCALKPPFHGNNYQELAQSITTS